MYLKLKLLKADCLLKLFEMSHMIY